MVDLAHLKQRTLAFVLYTDTPFLLVFNTHNFQKKKKSTQNDRLGKEAKVRICETRELVSRGMIK